MFEFIAVNVPHMLVFQY